MTALPLGPEPTPVDRWEQVILSDRSVGLTGLKVAKVLAGWARLRGDLLTVNSRSLAEAVGHTGTSGVLRALRALSEAGYVARVNYGSPRREAARFRLVRPLS